MEDRVHNSLIRHTSADSKMRFKKNVLQRCKSLAILAKAIEERPEDVFRDNISDVCDEIKETYGMRNSPNIEMFL